MQQGIEHRPCSIGKYYIYPKTKHRVEIDISPKCHSKVSKKSKYITGILFVSQKKNELQKRKKTLSIFSIIFHAYSLVSQKNISDIEWDFMTKKTKGKASKYKWIHKRFRYWNFSHSHMINILRKQRKMHNRDKKIISTENLNLHKESNIYFKIENKIPYLK